MKRAASAIVVHPDFDGTWPFAADYWREQWMKSGAVDFLRLDGTEIVPFYESLKSAPHIRRLAALGINIDMPTLAALPKLEEIAFGIYPGKMRLPDKAAEEAKRRAIAVYEPTTEGFWGQSVAEFGLALTICGLRRIPQTHRQIVTDLSPWDYTPPACGHRNGRRGAQFGDDPNFTNGTIAGKRVRIVGAGNIGSRFASFCSMMRADVAAWDPFAAEPSFHRSGTRREWHLSKLVEDAEIFAPMLPATDKTRGIIDVSLIDRLPKGCLVVLVTRAIICDVPALRRRVLAGQLALAADVFDVEPLPLDDPLLGHPNVVHTPHNGGRTIDANREFADAMIRRFRPDFTTQE
ncbi:NAD(P)-dependent oxidoreductase [Bradyrhizobium sp. USDA 4529]